MPSHLGTGVAVRTLIVTVAVTLMAASCTKPLPGDLSVTEVTTGRSLAPDGTIVEDTKTNSFWTTDTFYASVKTQGAANNVAITGRWTGPDGKVVAEVSKTVSPSGDTVTGLEAPPKEGERWAAGDYKLEVLVNGTSTDSKDLVVH